MHSLYPFLIYQESKQRSRGIVVASDNHHHHHHYSLCAFAFEERIYILFLCYFDLDWSWYLKLLIFFPEAFDLSLRALCIFLSHSHTHIHTQRVSHFWFKQKFGSVLNPKCRPCLFCFVLFCEFCLVWFSFFFPLKSLISLQQLWLLAVESIINLW